MPLLDEITQWVIDNQCEPDYFIFMFYYSKPVSFYHSVAKMGGNPEARKWGETPTILCFLSR